MLSATQTIIALVMSCGLGLSIDQARRWGLKGGVSLLDQGLFSGSNFVLNVLLARWLDPAAFGAFVVAFAVYLFFTGFHNALILEPMSVLGPSRHGDQMPRYIAYQFRMHAWLAGALALAMLLFGALLLKYGGPKSDPLLASAVMAAGVALPFMLFIWLARRIFYVLSLPAGALSCSVLYAMSLAVGAYLVRLVIGASSIWIWFALMAAASALGGAVPLLAAKIRLTHSALNGAYAAAILSEHWIFGRWLVAATILYTVGAQIQVFLAAGLLGLDAAGIWRAVQNFALPMIQSITAVAALGLPALSREFGAKDFRMLRRKGLLVTVSMTALAIAYEAVLVIFARPLEHVIYGSKFEAVVWLIPLVGLVPILAAMETGFSLIVRSLQRPAFYVVYNASMALAGIVCAPFLIHAWGLAGAAASQILVAIVSLVVILYIYQRWYPRAYGDGLRPQALAPTLD